MPGASAAGGYAANAGQFGPIGTGTAAGSAAASGYPLAASGGGSFFTSPYLFAGINALATLSSANASAKAQRAEGDFQASIYESNARIQALMAEDAIIRGDKEAVKAKQLAKRIIGSQRAAMGAQGIDLESGSALDIQEETASLGAEEALNIRNNAWREAWGYRAQGSEYLSRASFAKITGKNTSKNTLLTGGLSALKGLAYADYMNKNRGSGTYEDYISNFSGGL
jgi:hypothetical protein